MAESATETRLRIIMLGKSPTELSRFSDFLTRECIQKKPVRLRRSLTIVQTLGIFSRPENKVKHDLRRCIAQCTPGPNVLLLLVNPLDFTEENRQKLNVVLRFFGDDAFKHSMVIITQSDVGGNSSVNQLVEDCTHNVHTVNLHETNLQGYAPRELISEMEIMVQDNRERHLNFSGESEVPCPKECVNTAHRPVSRCSTFSQHSNFRGEKNPFSRRPSFKSFPPPIPMNRSEGPESPSKGNSTECLRMVLIGMTGGGKSATGNTILGQHCFDSAVAINSVTRQCQSASGMINGQRVALVDTPGLFDTSFSNEDTKMELAKCISMLAPGPHVFLLVLKIGRFTPGEKIAVELITTFFGEKSKDFIIIIFTWGDDLHSKSIDSYLAEDKEGSLIKLTTECGGGYLVFNNKDQENRSQVSQLLAKVEAMVKRNGNGYYTTGMFRVAEEAIDKETQKAMKEKEAEIQMKQMSLRTSHQEELKRRKETITELNEILTKTEELKKLREKIKSEKERNKEEEYDKAQKGKESKRAWWKRRNQDEKTHRDNQELLKKLKEVYEKELQDDDTRKQDARLRIEEERRQLKKVQEEYEKGQQEIKRKHEEEARKQVQEFIYVRHAYITDVSHEFDTYLTQMQNLLQRQQTQSQRIREHLCQNRANKRDYDKLRSKQEREENDLRLINKENKENLDKGISELKRRHEEERQQWINEHLKTPSNNQSCVIL